jgi:hypothetical protein
MYCERLVPDIVKGIVIWPDDRAVQDGFFTVEDLDFSGWTHVASSAIDRHGGSSGYVLKFFRLKGAVNDE